MTVTCTCPLEACTDENFLILVLKNGQDVEVVGNNVNHDQELCRTVYTFQADPTDDDGAKFSCSAISDGQIIVSKSVPIHLSG